MEALPRELLLAVFQNAAPFGPAMRWVCARWRGIIAAGGPPPASGRLAHEDLAASGCAPLAAWARDANQKNFTTGRANQMLLAAARSGAEEMFVLVFSWSETVPLLVAPSGDEARKIVAAAEERGCRAITRQARIWLAVAKNAEQKPFQLAGLLRLMISDGPPEEDPRPTGAGAGDKS